MPYEVQYTLKGMVFHAISIVSGFAEPSISPSSRLWEDLRMAGLQRQALAKGFQRLARVFKADAIVTQSMCADLDTVDAAVKLVSKVSGVGPNTPVREATFHLTSAI